jgi:glutamine synthetase
MGTLLDAGDRPARSGRFVGGARRRNHRIVIAGRQPGFIEQHGLWRDDQRARVADVLRTVADANVEVVRVGFADQHGIVRGKTIVASEFTRALRDGYNITTTLLLKDTSHQTVFPVFTAGSGIGMPEVQGAGDMVMVPDPGTFHILPWAPHSGWILSDLYFRDGSEVPFSTRAIYRRQIDRLAADGYDFLAGLEVEFHLFRLDDAHLRIDDSGEPGAPGTPPAVSLLTQGYQYLTESRYDQMDDILEILRKHLTGLGLPVRSLECEFGPSQVELTFGARCGMEAPDMMILLRNAIKQVARRHGHHATFMCRPRIPNVMSSGWHLHQSLVDRRTGANAFATAPGSTEPLTAIGLHYLGGLLAHARAAAVFSTPTINGYRRFRSHSLAPDRALWGVDNKAAMIRLYGGPGDPATHLENRVGEPAANPYLYMASQIVAGLDGMRNATDPGPSADAPYETPATPLPTSLDAALAALREDTAFRTAFGAGFIDYIVRIKDAESARFQREVSEWEHREYFDLF